jgi:hypothetical protein
MADNTVLSTGTGGDTIATDDIGGVKHQRVKLEHGADGSATDVSTASPLPTVLQTAQAVDGALGATATSVAVGGFDGTNYQAAVTDSAGRFQVGVNGSVPVTDNSGSLTVDATAATFANNQAQVAGTAVSVNSGAKDAGTQRVILASDQTVVPVSDNAGSLTVDAPVATPVFTRWRCRTA